MDLKKTEKNIDYSKINIGLEIECYIINADTFEGISQPESQKIMMAMIEKFSWKTTKENEKGEIQGISKLIDGYPVSIKLDVVYAIFEITQDSPVESLEILESINKQSIGELRTVLREQNLIIWPFGVAPASTGFLKLSKPTKEEIIDDHYYRRMELIDVTRRFAHITSHQVNIDIPLSKMIPAMNAFFKNLGTIIEKFSNSSVMKNGMFYKEGRYYWWNDCDPRLKTEGWISGQTHIFPPEEFTTWNALYRWVFKGTSFIFRNDWLYFLKDEELTTDMFLKKRKAIAIDQNNNEVEIELEKNDIENILNQIWLDFKPHFDFDQTYTLEEFLDYYNKNDLDGFFEKYCKHCWLEIRSCSPHFEENAMVIPRYFYDIILNLDSYIEQSKKITWEQARISRDKAIGYI